MLVGKSLCLGMIELEQRLCLFRCASAKSIAKKRLRNLIIQTAVKLKRLITQDNIVLSEKGSMHLHNVLAPLKQERTTYP